VPSVGSRFGTLRSLEFRGSIWFSNELPTFSRISHLLALSYRFQGSGVPFGFLRSAFPFPSSAISLFRVARSPVRIRIRSALPRTSARQPPPTPSRQPYEPYARSLTRSAKAIRDYQRLIFVSNEGRQRLCLCLGRLRACCIWR
jgi:hypothetical protein